MSISPANPATPGHRVGMLDRYVWNRPIPEVAPAYPGIEPYDEAVREWMRTRGVPGCAYGILYGDRILTTRSFGWAEIDKTEFRPGTLCRVASVSKTITAVALLCLH